MKTDDKQKLEKFQAIIEKMKLGEYCKNLRAEKATTDRRDISIASIKPLHNDRAENIETPEGDRNE